MSLARYGFLPWLRQGISDRINATDTLGGPADQTGRPTVDISLSVVGIPVNTFAIEEVTGVAENPDRSDKPVFKTLQLTGPGDITGIKAGAVVKTEPLAGVGTFEPNYLPYIEFYEEDFPWRYTPASAAGDKLRPWLVLVVLEDDEFERRFFPGAPLAAITNGTRPVAFPPKTETWAWAHVHVNQPLPEDGNITEITKALRELVDSQPNLASSRLICPRRLKPNTNYTGFLLPAFEQGRLAGLGAPAERVLSAVSQASSWEPHPSDEYAHLWPVYYEWNFRTGDLADFEYLVRRIEARVMEEPVGRRPIDLQEAGYELRYQGGDGTLLLEGALQLIDANEPGRRFDFLNGGDTEDAFIGDLQTLINLNTDLEEGLAGDAPVNQTLYLDDDGKDDPIITPPLYGQWHAGKFRADAGDPGNWFNELNLDPRNRTAAGFGTLVVRKNQDAYMDRAWEQVGEVLEAMRRIRLDRFAATAGRKLQTAYFEKMDDASFSAFSSSFHDRSRYQPAEDEDSDDSTSTVLQVVRERRVQPFGTAVFFKNQNAQLADLKTALEEAKARRSQLLQEIEAKETEIAATQGRISDLETVIADLTEEINTLIEEIQALDQDIGDKQTEIEALEAQIADEDDPDVLEDLNEQLDLRRAEKLALENQRDAKAAQQDDKETLQGQKGTELSQEQNLLQTQQDELAALQDELTEVEAEIDHLESEIERVTGVINRLTRLNLPATALRQDYRKTARPNGPLLRRVVGVAPTPDVLIELTTLINVTAATTEADVPPGLGEVRWEDIDWGSALYQDPPAPVVPVVENIVTTSTNTITQTIQRHIRAAAALNKRTQNLFAVKPADPPAEEAAEQTPKPLITYPEFKEATYSALAEISSELMLPNVQLIPMDTFSLLEVNQRFIESYLIGLNHEMARELLWREYPTDQRGSYFRRFWDDLDNDPATPPPPDIKILTELNDHPLGQNMPADRGIPLPDPDDPHVVFVIRSELLKKFPNALVYMQQAKFDTDKEAPRLLTNGNVASGQRIMPIFKASIYPEVSFFGFPITVDEATGDKDDPGWFFVVQERPGEPRFGLDIEAENTGDDFDSIGEWNDLAWPMVATDDQHFLRVTQASALTKPPKAGVADAYTWGRNGAHMAGILLQLPFMVAVHATDMIKLPE